MSVFWCGAGVALLWASLRLTERWQLAVILLALATAGGLARAWSVVQTGWPHPVYVGVMAFELIIVPALAAWTWRSRSRTV